MSEENFEEQAPEQETLSLPEQPEDRAGLIEALIFAHGEPISIEMIAELSGLEIPDIAAEISVLQQRCREHFSGIELVEVAHKFQFRTTAAFSDYLRRLKTAHPRKLSGPALEALAIVAYRQPIVKSDIETLRGVDCTPVLKTLLDRGLIRIVGHQPSVGNPALYGTSEEFLKLFGLRSLEELPTLRDLREFEDPGEVEEQAQGAALAESDLAANS